MELTTRMGNLTGDAQKDLKTLYSFVFQMNEEMRYLMNNLDVTNFNDLGLARYENGRMQIYTEQLEIQAEKLTAEFKDSDEQMKTTLEASIGGLRTEVTEEINGLGTRVSIVEQTADGLRSTVNSHTSSISSMGSQITQNEDKISLVVTENYGVKSIRAAEIVTAINAAGSSVKISADHVDITGVVTVTDLAGEGTVEINAGNIKAGGTITGVALVSTGDGYNESVSIDDGRIQFYSGYISDADYGRLNFYAYEPNFYTDTYFDFHLPSGNRIRFSDSGILATNSSGTVTAYYNFTKV